MRITNVKKTKLFGSHHVINRIAFLDGSNRATDGSFDTGEDTGVGRVVTRTLHPGKTIELEILERTTAVAVFTDGHPDDFKPIKITSSGTILRPGKRTVLFWGGSRLDALKTERSGSDTIYILMRKKQMQKNWYRSLT